MGVSRSALTQAVEDIRTEGHNVAAQAAEDMLGVALMRVMDAAHLMLAGVPIQWCDEHSAAPDRQREDRCATAMRGFYGECRFVGRLLVEGLDEDAAIDDSNLAEFNAQRRAKWEERIDRRIGVEGLDE